MHAFRFRAAGLAAIALCAAAFAADAQTLYKLIAKDGKVTYVQDPPKNFDGQVIRIDVDPKANTATLPKPPAAQPAGDRRALQAAADDKVRAAREKLDAARKALADARDNPAEGDIARMGKKGGGTRPVPTEDYQRRLDKLERAVKDAEEELQKAERAR